MKDLKEFIIESSTRNFDKYYVELSKLKDGDNLIACWVDNDSIASPFNIIVKKKGSQTLLVNPDDENDIIDWHNFVNGGTEDKPMIAIFDDIDTAQELCDYYNEISEM